MNRSQRKAHKWIWLILLPALAGFIAVAHYYRPSLSSTDNSQLHYHPEHAHQSHDSH